MEILQGAIKRDDYFSVKETAEILGVTTKTVRNRIDKKQLSAVWYEVGKGQSQWLIPREEVSKVVDGDISAEKGKLSVPQITLIEAIKAQLKADNDVLREENNMLRNEIQDIKISQARIEKMLIEREKFLIEIAEKQAEKEEEQKSPWWKFWK